jgi:hypothetical protein
LTKTQNRTRLHLWLDFQSCKIERGSAEESNTTKRIKQNKKKIIGWKEEK